ncbi:protein kinase [Streptomyces sp. NPDC056479]|uniref:serine/threonine-protein kinase n=1 Tax=Streptomyces sp. NPDC056479 TaxID=3345832 RepID=UPI00367C1789
MGRVWRAVDEILDRLVAVKEMRIDGLDPEDTRTRRERTLREARATARIDHPNVVRVYDVVDEGERLWIVMELVAGRSLERIMAEEGPLGPRETARIGVGLVAALRQVHDRGVLHRDIKPGNVLVEAEVTRGRGRVVLTDFGIAAIQDAKALTMVGMLVGSPDYMAPERISGRPQGPPSDIWSLGATLSAALAGRSPFSRDTTLATLHAVLYEEPELPPAAGPLRDILAALLEKDPTLRPGLDEVETALQRVAYPIPTPTMPVMGEPEPEPAPVSRPAPESGALSEPEPTGPSGREHEAEPEPEPEQTPTPPRESPTPAFLDVSRPPSPPDPRQPEEIRDAIPPQPAPTKDIRSEDPRTEDPRTEAPRPGVEQHTINTRPATAPTPVPAPAPDPPRPLNASTEATTPESRSEVHSATPSGNSTGPTPRRTGVSLSRSEAMTERRPAPGPGRAPGGSQEYGGMPPGELPGPAVAARPRPRRGYRRTGIVAAAGIAAAGAVVAVVLVTDFGARKDDQASSSPSASSAASSPDASPSSTVEGTSRPQSLPPGARREAGGFAWAPPEGWRRDVQTGSEVHYTSPDAAQELAAKSSLARDDLMDSWQQSEQNAQQGKDYVKIRLERTTFREHPAVVWEYTFTLNGDPWHARLLGFTVDGRTYQINTWYRPDIEAQALKTYEKVRDGFTVL